MAEESNSLNRVAALRQEQHRNWANGERLPAEAYVQRHPELQVDAEAVLELIYNEIMIRQRLNEAPRLAEYQQRFPSWAAQLELLFEVHSALEACALPAASSLRGETDPTMPEPSAAVDLPPVPGYEIIRELGRGGVGVVYAARQLSLNRTVALKMLLAGGHAGSEQRARFRTEAEALARLRHPNIVPVYEVGEHDGRPYLVMEYINGGSLAARLDGAPWPVRNAAILVETLATAIHHAHERGIVHRDVTPANILLASLVGSPCSEATSSGAQTTDYGLLPKITDFGLAKLHLEERAARTQSGMILGTPSYMAPEQAEGRSREIGPRADVYALGAILYELLTGRPPFKGETPLDTLQQVLATEPVPPRRLQPKVPSDLETICLKCLHKDAGKRYGSAESLAEDLRRFLAGEPVRARPVGSAARLWRWCRRKPTVASLIAALALASTGGVLSVTGLWLKANYLRGVAEANQAQAEADFRLAREAVDDYATRVSENLRLRLEDLHPLRKELLETVVPFYEKLLQRHGDNPGVQAERGRAYVRLGEITQEIDDLFKAGELYEQAVAIFAELVDRAPDDRDYRVQLAKAWHRLSAVQEKTGRTAQAEAGYLQERQVWEGLIGQQAEADFQVGLVEALLRLAGIYDSTGRIPAARTAYQQALRIREELEGQQTQLTAAHRQAFAQGHRSFGLFLVGIGEAAEAEAELGRAFQLQEPLARAHPEVPDYQHHLALVRRNLATIYQADGRVQQARTELEKAFAASAQLVRQYPSVLDYVEALAESRRALFDLDKDRKETAALIADLQNALQVLRPLAQQQPRVSTYQERLARLSHNLCVPLRLTGRWEDALAAEREAERILEGLVKQEPEVTAHRGDLVDVYNHLSVLAMDTRRLDDAETVMAHALPLAKALVEQQPQVCRYCSELFSCRLNRGMLYYQMARKQEAEVEILEAVRLIEELARRQPQVIDYQAFLARSHNNLAVLYVDGGRPKEADAAYVRSLAVLERLVHEHPENTEYAVMFGGYSANQGIHLRNTDRLEAALETFAKAVRILDEVLRKEPQHVRAKAWLCNAHWDRGGTLRQLERFAEAAREWEQALPLDDGRRRDTIRVLHAEAVARTGDHARAIAEAQEVAAGKTLKPDNFYKLAWACAAAVRTVQKDAKLPSAERAQLTDRYAAFGVDLLLRGEAAGLFKEAEHLQQLRTDTHLDPLRQRAEFQKLLERIQAKEVPKAK